MTNVQCVFREPWLMTKVMDWMKIVRRTHLYAGLFLAPWVAMYGFSGLIFNHFSWFAPAGGPATSRRIEWSVDVTALPPWPEPEALAHKVVASLNAAQKDEVEAVEYRLSADGEPRLQGGVRLEGQDEAGSSVSLFFDRQGRKGVTSHSPPRPPEPQVQLGTNDVALLNTTKEALLAAASKADPKLSAMKWTGDGDFPHLSFPVVHGQERHVATYDLRTGLVSFSEPRSMRASDFLTSLHVSHGYPSDPKSEKVRTVRAVFVDAMAFLTCFWALSGVVMWWQLKQLRRPGLWVTIASLLSTVWIWSAMYRMFAGQ